MEDFDGIEERQDTKKKLPIGWLSFFIGVIVWGLWYSLMYTPIGSWSQTAEYEAKVKAETPAPLKVAATAAPKLNPFKGDTEEIQEGAKVYAANCSSCHGGKGEGGVGPSLVAGKFEYGGADHELFASVMEGREGGMPPFKTSLGDKKVWEALAYIDSVKKN